MLRACKMTEQTLTKISQVDDRLLKEIVNRILRVAQPDKIILFGSYASGKTTDDSDLDILVIMQSELPRYKRAVAIYKALAGLLIPKDILVYTKEEIDEWTEVPQAFITTVINKGKVIYEKEQS